METAVNTVLIEVVVRVVSAETVASMVKEKVGEVYRRGEKVVIPYQPPPPSTVPPHIVVSPTSLCALQAEERLWVSLPRALVVTLMMAQVVPLNSSVGARWKQ
jgi:hypothetical protein